MGGHVLRRSLLSLSVLAVLLATGGALLVAVGTPVWVPLLGSAVIVGLQWLMGPWLVQWLVPARELARTADGYASDHPVADLVARRCRDADLPLPRLGIVDDGTPNAFTFGRTRRDARLWVTRGLLERLDERELDAVISHEVGHVRQNDFVIMTVAAVVPLVLYYAYLLLWSSNDARTKAPAIGAYVAYLVAQLAVLALSRSRELGADHWSCQVTGDGDALCSALVKIGYGMGEVDAERARRARAVADGGSKDAKKEQRKGEARHRRIRTAGVLGIADPAQGPSLLAATEQGMAPREVVGAMRWDTCNPWARFQQVFSTHPLVVRRVAELERSGLPGAPTRWNASDVEKACAGPELSRARRRFAGELVVRALPILLAVGAVLAWATDRYELLAQLAVALGAALLVRAYLAHRPGPYEPVDRIAGLLGRLDASPVTGLPVSVRGRVIGRGSPGYVLSPDLVVQDSSGFAPVLYRQPWPLARTWFGLLRVEALVDQEVVVTGWYRRTPAPVLELKELVPASGKRVRGFWWIATYLVGAALALTGGIAYGLLAAF